MLCTVIKRNNRKEILYKESNEWQILDVPEDKLREIQKCSYDRVQDLISQLMDNRITKHHLISRSNWWTDHPDNIRNLRENTHRALHQLLSDKTPVQQLRRMLELNRNVFVPHIYNRMSRLLYEIEQNEISAYKKSLFNPNKFREKNDIQV